MNTLDRVTAETYASWFRCLADPTRLQILHVLAGRARALRVGEVAQAVGVAQSTASVHLQRLLEDEFVRVDRSTNSSWYQINPDCIEEFPRAAAQVMGALSGTVPLPELSPSAPWHQRAGAPRQGA